MDNAFSNRLLHVQLFQGLSRLDFLDIAWKIPFDFRSFKPGETLVSQDAESHTLCIVLKGELESEVKSPNQKYVITEHISAPWVIQPECLFGLHNRYSRTIRAHSDVQILLLNKQSVRKLLSNYPAFQINFYNLLSTIAQQRSANLWLSPAPSLDIELKQFLLKRSLRPIGYRGLMVKMEDLAEELGATRLRVSQMLAQLAQMDLLTYSRQRIVIPHIENL